mgnify:CR=1 FL=1
MIYEDILPRFLNMGVSYDFFMDSCPAKLKPFEIAYKEKLKQTDQLMHMFGMYVESAVQVAVERNLYGKKSKNQYMKEPMLMHAFEDEGLTQEEIDAREIRKMILAEEQWIALERQRGLPETKIKKG